MRILSLMILIGIVALMFMGQATYQSDVEHGTERDIYNFTESTINWNTNITEKLNENWEDSIQVLEYDVNIKRFQNILGKFIDFVGYSSFEMAKWGIEYGYTHPEYDLRFFLEILIKILWIIVIIIAITSLAPLIIPLIALIYLFFKGIYYLIKKVINLNEKTKKT